MIDNYILDLEFLKVLLPEFDIEGDTYIFKINDDKIIHDNKTISLISNDYKFLVYTARVKPTNQFILYDIPSGDYTLQIDDKNFQIELSETTPSIVNVDYHKDTIKSIFILNKPVSDFKLYDKISLQEFTGEKVTDTEYHFETNTGEFELLGAYFDPSSVVIDENNFNFNIDVLDIDSLDTIFLFIEKIGKQPIQYLPVNIRDMDEGKIIYSGRTTHRGEIIFKAVRNHIIRLESDHTSNFDPNDINIKNFKYIIRV